MLLILTGPAGAGKNTVGHILAQLREKCAVVDADDVRHMAIKPHIAPWYGEAGLRQVFLGVKNASALAQNFNQEGFDVIILDVLTEDSAKMYREILVELNPKIVVLYPNLEAVKKRNSERNYNLAEDRLISLHQEQGDFKNFDEKIDNTSLSAQDTATQINDLF